MWSAQAIVKQALEKVLTNRALERQRKASTSTASNGSEHSDLANNGSAAADAAERPTDRGCNEPRGEYWEPAFAPGGKTYYWNLKTKATDWVRPHGKGVTIVAPRSTVAPTVATIRARGPDSECIHLGTFATPLQAAEAYDQMAVSLGHLSTSNLHPIGTKSWAQLCKELGAPAKCGVGGQDETACKVQDETCKEKALLIEWLVSRKPVWRTVARQNRAKKLVLKKALAAVSSNGLALARMPDELQQNRAVAAAAVAQHPLALQFAPAQLRGDPATVSHAVARDVEALRFASAELRDDPDFALSLIAGAGSNWKAIERVTAGVTGDKRVMLVAVTQHWNALKYGPLRLRKDKDVVLAAVSADGRALRHAGVDLKRDKGVVLAAVSSDGRALQHASLKLQGDREVVLAAVAQSALAYQYASRAQQRDADVIIATARHRRSSSEDHLFFTSKKATKSLLVRALELADENHTLLAANGTLLARARQTSAASAQLAVDIHKLTAQSTELTAQNTNLTSQNAILTTQTTELPAQIFELTAQNTKLTAQNTELTARNTNLTAQNIELAANAHSATVLSEVVQAKNRDLLARIKALEGRVARAPTVFQTAVSSQHP
jgi:cell division protein FtsB